MDLATWVLFGVIGVMVCNQLVMRLGALRSRVAVFWSMQALNVGTGSAILLYGLPGFEPWPAVAWVIGLLFFLRAVQNTNARAKWLRAVAKEVEAEQRAAVREALRRAAESSEEEADPTSR